ncbi:MAG: tetratricopeptide repeat protein [Planctomycetota bacterium]|jgi:lipoprotein NlpI|nr:tetratricopeptide repeat protein [Planctomycetota bacterium]
MMSIVAIYLMLGQADPLLDAQNSYRKQDYAAAAQRLEPFVKENPDAVEALSLLGTVEFMRGDMVKALVAWDRQVKVHKPSYAPHWQRGIALYYAGRHKEGREQFEAYQAVDGNDVENSVWKLMCQAREPGQGLEKAQKNMLPIGLDRRVPMMEVLDLYAGKSSIEKVKAQTLKAPENQGTKPQFYEALYLGLWEDLQGNVKASQGHFERAMKLEPASVYMREVGRVHRDLALAGKLPWKGSPAPR